MPFLDEPLSNLDAKLRVQMRSELKELHQRLSTTTIYVTHDQIEAMTLSDLVVVMNGGRILADGTPEELRAQVGGARVRFVSGLTLAELRRLPGVEQAGADAHGHADLHTRTPEALLTALVQSGTPFTELEVTRATLEDAFLRLTA